MPDWIISLTSDSTRTENGKRTGTTIHQVQASEPTTTAAAELADESTNAVPPGSPKKTPRIGQNFLGESGFPCVSRSCVRADGTRMLFTVTSEYDTTSTFTENPLTEPLKVSYGPQTSEESYFEDKTTPTPRRAVMTSEEPFSELPKRKVGELQINISVNVTHTTNYSAYEAFCDEDGLLVNDEIVTIDGRAYAVGTLLALPPTLSDIKTQDSYQYKTLATTLLVCASGWLQKFESRGLYEWDSLSGDILRILDQENQPVEQPLPLDEVGTALAPDATGFTIELKPYGEGDFTPLL